MSGRQMQVGNDGACATPRIIGLANQLMLHSDRSAKAGFKPSETGKGGVVERVRIVWMAHAKKHRGVPACFAYRLTGQQPSLIFIDCHQIIPSGNAETYGRRRAYRHDDLTLSGNDRMKLGLHDDQGVIPETPVLIVLLLMVPLLLGNPASGQL